MKLVISRDEIKAISPRELKNLREYQIASLATESVPVAYAPLEPSASDALRLGHMLLGLATEIDELLAPDNTVAKNVVEEFGDMLWYGAVALYLLGDELTEEDLTSQVVWHATNREHMSTSDMLTQYPIRLRSIANELADLAKRVVFYHASIEHPITNRTKRPIISALSTAYIVVLAELGIDSLDLMDIAQRNHDKLTVVRYPDGKFDSVASVERKLEEEYKVLNRPVRRRGATISGKAGRNEVIISGARGNSSDGIQKK